MKIHTAKHQIPADAVEGAEGEYVTPHDWVELCAPVRLPGRWLGDWHDLPAGTRMRLVSMGDAATCSVFEIEQS